MTRPHTRLLEHHDSSIGRRGEQTSFRGTEVGGFGFLGRSLGIRALAPISRFGAIIGVLADLLAHEGLGGGVNTCSDQSAKYRGEDDRQGGLLNSGPADPVSAPVLGPTIP
jgi:hypothetical protein